MTEVDQMSERKEIRRRIVFYGRVQGVGFRYRAQYAAEQYRLTGWVYNEDDRYIDIVDMDMKQLVVQEDEWSFHIRY